MAAACIALHALVAVVLRLKVHDSGAVRAFAFVLAAIVPCVVVALGDLCQRLGFGLRIIGVLARLAGKAVRVAPWRFGELRSVSAAQATNVVLIANRVAVFLCHTDGGVQARLPLLEDQGVQVRVIAAWRMQVCTRPIEVVLRFKV